MGTYLKFVIMAGWADGPSSRLQPSQLSSPLTAHPSAIPDTCPCWWNVLGLLLSLILSSSRWVLPGSVPGPLPASPPSAGLSHAASAEGYRSEYPAACQARVDHCSQLSPCPQLTSPHQVMTGPSYQWPFSHPYIQPIRICQMGPLVPSNTPSPAWSLLLSQQYLPSIVVTQLFKMLQISPIHSPKTTLLRWLSWPLFLSDLIS